MSLKELKEQAVKLSVSDRLALISAIVESLHTGSSPIDDSGGRSLEERSNAIRQMIGLLKTDEPSPTDEEVAAMLEERRLEKYLS